MYDRLPDLYAHLSALTATVNVINARFDQAILLHKPREPRSGIGVHTEQVCGECSQAADRFDEVEWPCETVRILTGEQ